MKSFSALIEHTDERTRINSLSCSSLILWDVMLYTRMLVCLVRPLDGQSIKGLASRILLQFWAYANLYYCAEIFISKIMHRRSLFLITYWRHLKNNFLKFSAIVKKTLTVMKICRELNITMILGHFENNLSNQPKLERFQITTDFQLYVHLNVICTSVLSVYGQLHW